MIRACTPERADAGARCFDGRDACPHAFQTPDRRTRQAGPVSNGREANLGSIRTIEKCGAVLENVVSGPDLETPKRRCWIEIG
jgi:hypothetical protein